MDLFNDLGRIFLKRLTRKEFLKTCVKAGIGLTSATYFSHILAKYEAYAAIGEKRGLKEAYYYKKIAENIVKCELCPEGCVLKDGQRGFCRVREPLGGKLYSLVYELVCAEHVDPIEKKPLFHFLPGTKSYSIATAGCNSRCKYCQNWTISQRPPEETNNKKLAVGDLAAKALYNSCRSISYTYSEPNIFYEYVMEASKAARARGLRNICVTGGKINPAPVQEMCRYIDAANVDLKGFDRSYLKETCAQNLDTILETLATMKKNNVWIEITNLIVPTMNDKMDDIRKMVKWIKSELGGGIPLHFSRFWPQYKLRYLYPTPVETLKAAREIALGEGMSYVYIGNIPETAVESTMCPGCKKEVIKRLGYKVIENNLVTGKCGFCDRKIEGVWD